ncbi:MAG TPA: hemerythrin domain-containing protein [Chitinophagaceae bacterium]|nr:hemerythrin domain-containing protein [Chitinophagaceae bacterium]
MSKDQPIKRSAQLAPLSREHHEALVFLLRIKTGLKNGTHIQVISDYINWFWINNLKEHFDQEEKLLLPTLAANDELAIQLKKEHQAIRAIVSGDLDKMQIMLLSDLLNAHIRFEERLLFPHIEQRISVLKLNEIFRQLDRPVQCQTSWTNTFWMRKKP